MTVHEFDLYGVFVPDLLVWAIAAYLVGIPVRGLLSVVGLYRRVWHRALFDAALYVLLLAAVVALAHRYLR